MSFRRELAKAMLAEVVSATAADRAQRLKESAQRDAPGLYRDSKRAVADVADGISDDPHPVVDLVEMWWDSQKRSGSGGRTR
jgi:hypothetical protein